MTEVYPKWQLIHMDASGNVKPSSPINIADDIASIEGFEVDSYGDSLDGAFSGVVSRLNISSLDVFEFQFKQDAISNWVSIYSGELLSPGVNKSFDNSRLKTVGLSQRLYQTSAQSPIYGSDGGMDIGLVARTIIKDLIDSGRIGNILIYDVNELPIIGAEIDLITVGTSSVGDLMDLLCSSWTDMVWGVTPDRKVFMKQITPTLHALTNIERHRVVFKEADDSKVVNRVDFSIPVPKTSDSTTYSVKDLANFNLYKERRIVVDVPSELKIVQDIREGFEYTYFADNGSWYDGISEIALASNSLVSEKESVPLRDRKGATNKNGYVKISKIIPNVVVADEILFRLYTPNPTLASQIGLILASVKTYVMGNDNVPATIFLDLIEFSTGNISISIKKETTLFSGLIGFAFNAMQIPLNYYQFPTTSNGSHAIRLRVQPQVPTPVEMIMEVYEMKPYKIDYETLNNVAKTYFSVPTKDPGTVICKEIILPRTDVTTNSIYGLINSKAKLYKYVFDKKGYAQTIVELEQKYNQNQESTSSLIKSRDRNSVNRSNSFTAKSTSATDENNNTDITLEEYIFTLGDNQFETNSITVPEHWKNKTILLHINSFPIHNLNIGTIRGFIKRSDGTNFELDRIFKLDNQVVGREVSITGHKPYQSWSPSLNQISLIIDRQGGGTPGDTDAQEIHMTAIIY